MEAQSNGKQKKSAGRVVLSVLLWLALTPLILVTVLGGSLYAYLSLSEFPYSTAEDIKALADKTMPADERVTGVDLDEMTFTLAVDTSDIAFVALHEGILNELLADAETALKAYDAVLEQYGFSMADGKITVTARLKYRDMLPVPVKAVLLPGMDDGRIALYLDSASIGPWIALPERLIKMADGEPVYTFTKRVHPRLEQLAGVSGSADRILLKFTFAGQSDLFQEIARPSVKATYFSEFLDTEEAALVRSGQYNMSDVDEPFRRLLDEAESTPERLMQMKRNVLALAGEAACEKYYGARDAAYQARFFPETSTDAVAAVRAEYEQAVKAHRSSFESLCRAFEEAYRTGGLRLTGEGVLVHDEKPTVAGLVGADAAEAGFVMEGSLIPLALSELTDDKMPFPAKTEGLSKLKDIAADEAAAQGLNLKKVVPFGLAFRQKNGLCMQMYVTAMDMVYFEPVTEEVYAAYGESESVPQWQPNGKMADALQYLIQSSEEQGYASLTDVTTFVVGADCTMMQNSTWLRSFADSICLHVPNLALLDLHENPYQSRNSRWIFDAILPTLPKR